MKIYEVIITYPKGDKLRLSFPTWNKASLAWTTLRQAHPDWDVDLLDFPIALYDVVGDAIETAEIFGR